MATHNSIRQEKVDSMDWLKRPRSQTAIDIALDSDDSRLKTILSDLMQKGIVSARGKLLRRYEYGVGMVVA